MPTSIGPCAAARLAYVAATHNVRLINKLCLLRLDRLLILNHDTDHTINIILTLGPQTPHSVFSIYCTF